MPHGDGQHFALPLPPITAGPTAIPELWRVYPHKKEVYGGVEMDKNEWSLTQVPRLENYRGMIFGCLDEKAEPLVDYLGDMAWYLDLITQKSKGGLEVRGEPPQRWIIDSNWKLGADNFVGDAYHTLMTHRSAVELGLAPPDPKIRVGAGAYQSLQRSRPRRPRG